MQRTVGGGSKGGGVVGGCRFLLSTPSVHIKILRVERMSSAVHVVGLNQRAIVLCPGWVSPDTSVFNFPAMMTFAHVKVGSWIFRPPVLPPAPSTIPLCIFDNYFWFRNPR